MINLYQTLKTYDKGLNSAIHSYNNRREEERNSDKSKESYEKLLLELNRTTKTISEQIYDHLKKNNIFMSAVNGRSSVSDSLEDLASYNKGIKKFLPRKKNDVINNRVYQIGELIDMPFGLTHNGLFFPDNFLMGMVYTSAIVSVGLSYAIDHASVNQYTENGQAAKLSKDIITNFGPVTTGAILGIIFGHKRFESLNNQRMQTKYVDEKLLEFYGKNGSKINNILITNSVLKNNKNENIV